MPDKEKTTDGLTPEAMQSAAAAAEQAAAMGPESMQAAQQIIVNTDGESLAKKYVDLVYTPEEFKSMIERMTAATADIMQTINTGFKDMIEVMQPFFSDEWIKALKASLSDIANTLLSVFESDEWHELESLFPGITTDEFFLAGEIIYQEYEKAAAETDAAGDDPKIEDFLAFFYEIVAIREFIPETLKAYKKKSGTDKEITFLQFVEPKDPITGEPAESLFDRCRAKAAEKRTEDNELLPLKAYLPDKYIVPNSIISNYMTKGLVNAGNRKIDASRNHKGKYYVYADISLNPNEYALNGSFTRYDRRVLNGVCSLYESGNTAFTAEMVYRAMNGLTGAEYVSPQSKAAVTKSIEKMSDIKISIDAKEEFEKYKIPVSEATFYGKCLAIEGCKFRLTNGETYNGFKLLSRPILYQYAQQLKQVISVPIDRIAIKDVLPNGRLSDKGPRNSENFSLVREYLLQRIEIMINKKKHGGKYEPNIKISTFYEETETNTNNRKYTTIARKQAAQCLDYWKAIDYIRDYEFIKKGKGIDGIKIFL